MKALLAVLLVALSAGAEPRPIDDAEREAVATVIAYLAGNPAALYERLSADAPLRALPRDAALAELAVRAGPVHEARWRLQTVCGGRAGDVAFHVTFPSGYEDGLLFRMTNSGDRWSLHEMLTLAEDPAPPKPAKAALPPPNPMRGKLLLSALCLGILGALIVRRSRIAAALLLLLALVPLLVAYDRLRIPFPEPPKDVPFTELRALLPLREALARGEEPHLPDELTAAAREVGTLWILQSGARIGVAGDAADPLSGLSTVARTPLVDILRGRLALTNGRTADAAAAFTRAVDRKPLRDDILIEAALSFAVSPAELPFLRDPRFDGSRDERLHYSRAMRSSSDGDAVGAQRHLRTAWMLRPIAREELVREPRLFPLLQDVRTMSMVSFYSASEPLQHSAQFGKWPLPLPGNARALVSGDALTIQLPYATLEVPGGAVLAPPNARVVAATHWKQEEDAAALRDAATFLTAARTRASAGPARLTRAAAALADHNRWPDLLTLTNDLSPQTTVASPRLLVLRMRAFLRASRADEARALANGSAVRQLIARGIYPDTLLSIADAIATGASNRGAAVESLDTAERLYRAVTAAERQTVIAARLRQLQLRRALVTDGVVITTPHFDVRHDPAMNPAIAARIGELLEAELARLRQKLHIDPRTEPRRVTVNVLYWDDFRGGITGNDHILGLYDGEILFPFAVVNQFKPEVVAIITHELTHAIVAQATADNAPRWFQEGIAERMELVPQHENAFHDTATQFVLPLPLLDAVMENAADLTMTEQGYRVAQTFIRFLESRYGDHAIATLIASFAAGKNTDEALTALTGKSLDALNADFRQWGFANSANFTNTDPWPYGDLYSPGVDPRIKAGFKWKGEG